MLYAAYGSNLHPTRLGARLTSPRFAGTASVAGWELQFHKRGFDVSAKCNIIRADGHIHVAVYALTARAFEALDGIEGPGYERGELTVPGFGVCQTYFATACHIDDALLPYDWYRDLVLLGAARHRFPGAYRAAIQRIRTIPDPDFERDRKHRIVIADMCNATTSAANCTASNGR